MGQEPFDIPLFREIQKILASSQGPLNFELARQVATAVAIEGMTERAEFPEERRAYSEAARSAELLLSGYSRLTLEEPVQLEVVGRAWWVNATLNGWRWLLVRLAERFATELRRLGGGDDQLGGALQAGIGQVAPLLVGVQAGTLIGHLAKESLDRYDLPIPREDERRVFFVAPNIDAVASDYRFPASDFRHWLALHTMSRHLVDSAVPWIPRYLRSALLELVDSIEVDAADLERRLLEMQTKGIEALQEGFGGESALPIVHTERYRASLGRLRAFLAIYEGYSIHISKTVAPELLEESARIDEGMGRRRASASEGKAFLENVLGISLDRAFESSGATFCAAVAELRGVPSLNRVWDAPDNLPSAEEIRDPFAWIERVAGNE